jgi:two-component system chemotaxis response regulator CheB
MPENFTNQFSYSLNSISKLYIKEAENNDIINIGSVLIAKGDWHLKVLHSGNLYKCKTSQDMHVNRHRPSVDVMFESVAKAAGNRTLGILLTGMGKDGARGLKSIKDAGGTTIVQEEKSCAVFGMPKAAIDNNAADHVLSIDEIINSIIEFSKNI